MGERDSRASARSESSGAAAKLEGDKQKLTASFSLSIVYSASQHRIVEHHGEHKLKNDDSHESSSSSDCSIHPSPDLRRPTLIPKGRRWAGTIKVEFNFVKGTYYQGSIYDAPLNFQSYGVPHGLQGKQPKEKESDRLVKSECSQDWRTCVSGYKNAF